MTLLLIELTAKRFDLIRKDLGMITGLASKGGAQRGGVHSSISCPSKITYRHTSFPFISLMSNHLESPAKDTLYPHVCIASGGHGRYSTVLLADWGLWENSCYMCYPPLFGGIC